ncbi:class I SAM-dependent methyltransferase [Candidatus Parcubacteria bacterium]|nr:class I SAM-dependent methyltransferase [Candidatus Parcubacteria bacterium]
MNIDKVKNIKCRLCDSEKTQFLFSKQTFLNYDDKIWNIYECLDCGLKFIQYDQYPNFDYEKFYNFRYKNRAINDDYIYKGSKYWKSEVQILKHLLPKKNIRILDVGCNTGNFLYYAPKSWEKCGVELSDLAAIGRKHGLNILQQNIEDIEIKENFFDIITMYALIEHLIDIHKVFNKIQSVLKPESVLAVMTSDSNSLKAKIKREGWHMYSPPEHQFFFTANSLDKFLAKYGFQLIYRYYTGGGMVDYFKNKYLTRVMSIIQNKILDKSFVKKFPIFDHMYSYYKLEKTL